MLVSYENLLALLLSFGLFTLFCFLGAAFTAILSPRKDSLRGALMAPGIGAAVLVLPVFVLNQMNLPVGRFAWTLAIVLCAAAAAILWLRRPRIPLRRIAPFAMILVFASLLTGYPLLLYGFNWISYGNNDMCSFVMMAHRFAAHGYYELPDAAALLNNRDLGASYWFSYAIEGTRCGSDLLIAWLISLTKLTGFQVYMPLLVALHLSLIAAAGALVLAEDRLQSAAILTSAWLAVSPLTTLGAMYQLMPQVLGLTLLAICAALLLEPVKGSAARFSFYAGVPVAALIVVYYEILPFLIAAAVLYHAFALISPSPAARPMEKLRSLILPSLGLFAVVALFLRSWLLAILPFLERQAGRSFEPADPNFSKFPYFLVPSGLADLWGFVPIGGEQGAGWRMNAAIAAGGLLLLIAAGVVLWQAWNRRPAALIAVVMLAVGAKLYASGGDFGLFKLAMYIQPFLLGSLVLAGVSARMRSLPLAIFLLIAAFGLHSQIYYVRRSLGGPGSFANLPMASSSRLLDQLARLRQQPRRSIVSDSDNVILSSLEAVYFNPAELNLPAGDFFQNAANLHPEQDVFRMGNWLRPNLAQSALRLARARQERDGTAVFDMKAGPTGSSQNVFYRWRGPRQADARLLATGSDSSPLNHRQTQHAFVAFRESREARDHLIAVVSQLGGSDSMAGPFGTQENVAFYSSEPDYFYPGMMTSVGRYLLFQILHPSARARLVVEYTATLNSDGENRIPPIAAIGSEKIKIASGARGAGRFFSPVIEPQQIEGDSYLMLDMGKEPFRMPGNKSGLMGLFGRQVRLDRRRITGFVRDISAISDEEYNALTAPRAVEHFPSDLANPNLEFSGVYEDGWASEDAFFVLQGSSRLKLKGAAPFGPIELTLLVDGRESAKRKIEPGDFELQSGELAEGKHRVEIRASMAGGLRAPDTRKASYLIRGIGF